LIHCGIRIANCGLAAVISKSAFRNPQLTPLTLLEAINIATAKLSAAGITTARLDAEVLLSHILIKDRTWLITHIHDAIFDEMNRTFEREIRRRSQREPLQYITGRQEFWGLEFKVTPDVLIPRPETELVVEMAVEMAATLDKPSVIVDLCTGSGCIAVSLAKELTEAHIVAVDTSGKALAVARENASKHGVSDRIRFLDGDLFQPLEELDIHGRTDIIVSNPPYVRSGDRNTLQPEVRDYEPGPALFAGPQGIEMHVKIIEAAPRYLKQCGALIMEMGLGQADRIAEMIQVAGVYSTPIVQKDLAGIERVIVARKK
jgi:release factor glutamine methyltransferase